MVAHQERMSNETTKSVVGGGGESRMRMCRPEEDGPDGFKSVCAASEMSDTVTFADMPELVPSHRLTILHGLE